MGHRGNLDRCTRAVSISIVKYCATHRVIDYEIIGIEGGAAIDEIISRQRSIGQGSESAGSVAEFKPVNVDLEICDRIASFIKCIEAEAVRTGSTGQNISTCAASEEVTPRATVQKVDATSTREEVVAANADELIGPAIASQGVS